MAGNWRIELQPAPAPPVWENTADAQPAETRGLHDSGGTLKEVAEFAAKREMKYPLAIDHPAKEEGWFGATFAAYGVRGIPAAAVIDRAGKVVFVGRFPEALERAAALLKDGQGPHKGR